MVTICRDSEELIEATMVSVLEQTYPDLEYVVVDGASTDGTIEIVQKVAARFPGRDVTWVSEPDRGIADAMNKGVALSSGDVINHLHAGDRFIHASVLSRVMSSHGESGWRWGVAGSVVVNRAGVAEHIYRPDPDHRALLKKNVIPHQSTFLVRDVFDRHGGFRADLHQASDYEFWMRICFLHGERYEVLPLDATYYLSGGGSSRVMELLRYLFRIRRNLRRQGLATGWVSDVTFLTRVWLFWAWSTARARLRGHG